eukprot:TRINITY_DN5988_c0_g2_i3.p2 TRINITY_DN5988_c0_g2~~TRINITY_DN5988_c0_g2_i3.p2  ORF type:complete len:228 (+),score=34.09 TRINITY_DN5988_c0_g2_i3:7-690(+)
MQTTLTLCRERMKQGAPECIQRITAEQQMIALQSNQGQQHQDITQFQHHHGNLLSSNSDLSMSFQSGGSSSLLKVGQIGEEVVKRVYPPLQNKAFEQLLHYKQPLNSQNNSKYDQILRSQQEQMGAQAHTSPLSVSAHVLGMLWSEDVSQINMQGFTSKLFAMIKEVLFSEKFSAFWDWFLMVVFPLLGYAGLSVCITLLFAGVALAWRQASVSKKFNNWFNNAAAA